MRELTAISSAEPAAISSAEPAAIRQPELSHILVETLLPLQAGGEEGPYR
jgi:hypothetical protein